MSVVDLIRDDAVRLALEPLLDVAKYARTLRVPTVVPWSEAAPASVMGTAFDYAVRFQLQRLVPGAVVKRWVAEDSLEHFELLIHNPQLRRSPWTGAALRSPHRSHWRATRRVTNARVFLNKHLKRRRIDDEWQYRLCQHALKLARIDACFRANLVDHMLVNDSPAAAAELMALVRATPLEQLAAARMWLNPTFGRHSVTVGGADADIIADTRLIEIKVRRLPTLEREDVRQLFIYAMLANLAHAEDASLPLIDTVQVYFARQAAFTTIDFRPVQAHVDYARARDAIIARAQKRLG